MMQLLSNYNIIALSLLSNKIWELITTLLFCLWSAFLWENVTYSTNVDDTTELFLLLKKISATYYFCSETRVKYDATVIPCGYIFGKNYIVYIQTDLNNIHNIKYSDGPTTEKQIVIIIYGWFSIRSLITKDIVSDKKGKYNLIAPGIMGSHSLIKEDYPEEHFHKNTYVAAKNIYESVQLNFNKSGIFLLYGSPGSGKTTTSKKLCDYCDETSYICSDITVYPGYRCACSWENNVMYYHNIIKPKDNKYLICVINEVDEIIDNIFKKEEKDALNSDVVYAKKRWNKFLDKIYMIPNVILLLTTNKTKDYFDSLDSSLFRKYRITKSFRFDDNDVIEDVFKAKPAIIVNSVDKDVSVGKDVLKEPVIVVNNEVNKRKKKKRKQNEI